MSNPGNAAPQSPGRAGLGDRIGIGNRIGNNSLFLSQE